MLEKIKEFQVYASAAVVLVGGAFYVFQLVTSVQATAEEYKTLKGEVRELRASSETARRELSRRQHTIDLKINRIETILERIDRRVGNMAPARAPQ